MFPHPEHLWWQSGVVVSKGSLGWGLRTGLVMMLFPRTRHFSPGCLSPSCCIDGTWQNTAAGYPWVWVAVCQKYTQLVHRRGSGITQSPAWILQHHIVLFSSVSLLCFLLTDLFPGNHSFALVQVKQFCFLEDKSFVESIISNNDLPSAKVILQAVVWRTCLNLSLWWAFKESYKLAVRSYYCVTVAEGIPFVVFLGFQVLTFRETQGGPVSLSLTPFILFPWHIMNPCCFLFFYYCRF